MRTPRVLAMLAAASSASALASAGACGAFEGTEVETTDTTDAGGDPSVLDGGGGGPEAGAGRCQGREIFVDDFTWASSKPERDWAQTNGKLSIDKDDGLPPPSVEFEQKIVDWSPETVSKLDGLTRTIDLQGATTLCIELDMMLQADPGDWQAPGSTGFVRVQHRDQSSTAIALFGQALMLFSDRTDRQVISGFGVKAWRHIVLRLPYDKGPAEVDTGVVTQAGVTLPSAPTSVVLEIGALSSRNDGGVVGDVDVKFDNVRITVE